jgi:hypothetical protein
MLLLTLTDFWQQNYLWIIIVAVVLVLALIGYLAEKNNVVSLHKKDEKKKEVAPAPMADMPVMETIQPKIYEPVVNIGGKQIPVDEIERINFDDEPKPKDMGEVTTPVFEDINIPQTNPVQEVVPTFEDLNVPDPDDLPPINGVADSQPIDIPAMNETGTINGQQVDPTIPPELYEPINNNGENTNTQSSETEVWKF